MITMIDEKWDREDGSKINFIATFIYIRLVLCSPGRPCSDFRERLLDTRTIYVFEIFACEQKQTKGPQANRYIHMEMMKIYQPTELCAFENFSE
jgi:hypothetical protein